MIKEVDENDILASGIKDSFQTLIKKLTYPGMLATYQEIGMSFYLV